MRLSQSAVKDFSSALRELAVRQELEDGTEVYLLEDANAAFSLDSEGQRRFQGISFEMAGRDFHVLANLELVISETVGTGEEAEDEAYVVQDQGLTELAAEYLLWRAKLLRGVGV